MSANKSFSTETSERYSRALFEVAKEAGDLEKIETYLNFAVPKKGPQVWEDDWPNGI